MSNEYFVLKKMKFSRLLFFILLFSAQLVLAQENVRISGSVINTDSKSGIVGAQISEKGTNQKATTVNDGAFSISVSDPNATLVVSRTGFNTKEVPLNGSSQVTIELESEAKNIQEVVLVGYGQVKKRDLTGTVSTLNSADITKRNTTNVLEAVQGNVPGVQINSSTGRLGDGFNLIIRGNNSISGGKPLYVVDGSFVDDISYLNPQQIERMDILKDASSAAIYGSRGSNGVVIITTKNGSGAKSGININFETSYGVKPPARLPEMMDGTKWWWYHQSAYLATTNGGNYSTVTPAQLNTAVFGTINPLLKIRAANNDTFDWYGAVLRAGVQRNNYLNLSGKSNSTSYNLGIGMQNETGNILNESLDKYTLNLGLNQKISDKFSAGSSINVSKMDEDLGSDLAMQEAFRLNPLLHPWMIDANGRDIVGALAPVPGKLFYPNGVAAIDKTSTYNPLLEIQNSVDHFKKWRLNGDVFVQYVPVTWLTLKSQYSGNYFNSKRGRSWGAQTVRGLANGNLPSSAQDNLDSYNQTLDNTANFNYKLGNHSFNLLGLQSMNIYTVETSFLSAARQPFDSGFYNIGYGQQSTYNLGTLYSKKTLLSYAARLNYGFANKYLITLSNRWDGSSVLAKGNKWASFPSAAIAWKVDEENFLKNVNAVSAFKIRLSYGMTGNDNVSPYTTLNGLNEQTFYDFNNNIANGYVSSSLANPLLHWEKTRELNAGIDFGFLKNRITGSVDVYDRLSKDLIYRQQLPLESGWAYTFSNVGSVSNKGVEVLLSTKNIATQKVSWTTTFTFTKNTNKLVSIYNQDQVSDIGNNLFLGQSINSYYNYVFDGIWQESERALAATFNQTPGQARVKDLNGDGKIDPVNDRTIIGKSDPDWSASVNSTLNIGNFDFSFSIFTNQGVTAFSPFHENFLNFDDRGRQKLNVDNWYIPVNSAGLPSQISTEYPMPKNEGTYWNNSKVGYYKNASFVKVKSIALGYTFSNDLTSQIKIKNARLYANVLNPFVFTKYDGYDPEWATAPFAIGRVSSITYQLGLSLNF